MLVCSETARHTLKSNDVTTLLLFKYLRNIMLFEQLRNFYGDEVIYEVNITTYFPFYDTSEMLL